MLEAMVSAVVEAAAFALWPVLEPFRYQIPVPSAAARGLPRINIKTIRKLRGIPYDENYSYKPAQSWFYLN
jgi:hypothetical protein